MRILQIYIGRAVINAVLLALVVVVGLNALGLLTDQLGDIQGEYNFLKVLQYVMWSLPSMAATSIGFSTMIGCLVGLGTLANHNELTVLRASGISLLQIILMALIPVLFFMGMSAVLEEASVYADRQAVSLRSLSMAAKPVKQKVSKNRAEKNRLEKREVESRQVWNRQGNEFIRFDQLLAHGYVIGVTRIIFGPDGQIDALQKAQSGRFVDGEWRLKNVDVYQLADGAIQFDSKSALNWQSELTPERLQFVSQEPDRLTVSQLTDYQTFLQGQGRDSRIYELEYWKKVLRPFVLISLVLLAISFVFGSLRQVTIAQRVFLGVIVGISFHILQDIVGTASLVYGFSPLSGVLAPIVACSVVGLFLLSRVR